MEKCGIIYIVQIKSDKNMKILFIVMVVKKITIFLHN